MERNTHAGNVVPPQQAGTPRHWGGTLRRMRVPHWGADGRRDQGVPAVRGEHAGRCAEDVGLGWGMGIGRHAGEVARAAPSPAALRRALQPNWRPKRPMPRAATLTPRAAMDRTEGHSRSSPAPLRRMP